MSEINVMPKSFIDRVNVLAHAKHTEEPLFVELEQTFCGIDAYSPVSVATEPDYSAVMQMVSNLHLSTEEHRKWEDAIGILVLHTQSAAFACGIAAGSIGTILFNGKKGGAR